MPVSIRPHMSLMLTVQSPTLCVILLQVGGTFGSRSARNVTSLISSRWRCQAINKAGTFWLPCLFTPYGSAQNDAVFSVRAVSSIQVSLMISNHLPTTPLRSSGFSCTLQLCLSCWHQPYHPPSLTYETRFRVYGLMFMRWRETVHARVTIRKLWYTRITFSQLS